MDFSQILGLFFLGFFLVLTDRLLDKSSLRFAPKKAGPRNAARAKPRQLSITKVSVSTPPSSQQQQQSQSNGENLSQLLGSTMSPAQLLRQSQMTSTIEEDDELESDAGPSNNVPAINHGIETPPATQQRSPWATRMRSSIPLPLDPDTLNSILGTTNRTPNNNSANTPAPTEQTITKQPTFLARKVTATQVKQVFVPLSRPRKTGSVSSTPRPTLPKEAESTPESSKSVATESSDSARTTPTEAAPRPTVSESIPVTTPAINLTPSVRRSSFISPSVAPFQKLKRPSRKPVTVADSATPEVEPLQPQPSDSSVPEVDNESLVRERS